MFIQHDFAAHVAFERYHQLLDEAAEHRRASASGRRLPERARRRHRRWL
jgi:hypothetical protein